MINEKLKLIHKELDDYIVYNRLPSKTDLEKELWVLDIEVCPTSISKDEILVYSICIMTCYDDNICYKYNNIEKFIQDLDNLDFNVIIYVHNLYYDIKPLMIEYFKQFGNNQVDKKYTKKTLKSKSITSHVLKDKKHKDKKYNEYLFEGTRVRDLEHHEYSTILNDNVLYSFKLGLKDKKYIEFRDSLKILPFSLQKCCKEFIGLNLPKDGLDYDKIRSADDELTKEEKIYIYNDVFGLSQLILQMVSKGFEINGATIKGYEGKEEIIKLDRLTSSSQALSDYKNRLADDFISRRNCFSNDNVYNYVNEQIKDKNIFDENKSINSRNEIIFKSLYNPLFINEYQTIKNSYFGGLCLVDYDNVKKFENDIDKSGVVLDVNSLYPSMMYTKLLPYGKGVRYNRPYRLLKDSIKEEYPLYFQTITITNLKLKDGKCPWLQIKRSPYFNGREVIKENIDKNGKRRTLKLTLSNVLLDLLYECYDVKGIESNCIVYHGAYDLYKSYIDFWSVVKMNTKGALRGVAKLRLNGLYGKMGSSIESEQFAIVTDSEVFKVNHHINDLPIFRNGIYMPMASFITSYARAFLVHAINENKKYFLYADTDSLHLKCNLDNVKGVTIDDNKFCCWKLESSFSDYKYISPKRYAEKDLTTGKWEVKCCGLKEEIMTQIDDITVFDKCKYTQAEVDSMTLYTQENTPYYYLDENCNNKLVGVLKSKKAKQVKKGTIILETPYAIR